MTCVQATEGIYIISRENKLHFGSKKVHANMVVFLFVNFLFSFNLYAIFKVFACLFTCLSKEAHPFNWLRFFSRIELHFISRNYSVEIYICIAICGRSASRWQTCVCFRSNIEYQNLYYFIPCKYKKKCFFWVHIFMSHTHLNGR